MKKFLSKVGTWLGARRERAKERRKNAMERRLELDSERAVQIMEFGGDIYIGYMGEPVLPIDGLKWDMAQTLVSMRGTYVEWHRRTRHARP